MVEPCRKEADMATKAFTIFSTNPKMDMGEYGDSCSHWK
jgi:hypothetical protein